VKRYMLAELGVEIAYCSDAVLVRLAERDERIAELLIRFVEDRVEGSNAVELMAAVLDCEMVDHPRKTRAAFKQSKGSLPR
jgi:hypothetical protein